MILLDAIYINDGGGKVLLDYLIEELEKTDKQIFYLLDKRVEGKIQQIKKTNFIEFQTSKFLLRKKFYKENRAKFSSILCLGNLPPTINLQVPTYTYFHQLLFLKIPEGMQLQKKIMYWLKTKILNSIKKNTNFWLVQTDLVKNGLSKKYNINSKKILILPFYPPFPLAEEQIRKKNRYLYVSNATPHKNHERLIKAFCTFYDDKKTGELLLTVNEDYPETLKQIAQQKEKGYPIQNIGFIKREELAALYQSSEYLIFPSLTESFGLGLVEAIENGCKIIAADLPYTYAVCKPSIVFNPLETEKIIEAFYVSLLPKIPKSESKVHNNLVQILDLLK